MYKIIWYNQNIYVYIKCVCDFGTSNLILNAQKTKIYDLDLFFALTQEITELSQYALAWYTY